MFVSPLHAHTDLSIASIMSWVDTFPDDFQIPPADYFLFAQGDSQNVLEHNVSFIHLDTPMKKMEVTHMLQHENILLSDTKLHTTLAKLPQMCLHTC